MNNLTVLKKISMVMAGAGFVALGTGGVAKATTTLTFDELPLQAVDDLSFKGVTFDFKLNNIDSTDASYNALGPGIVNFVQDPSLEGNTAGTLTLNFDTFVSQLEFGVALNTNANITPGFTVELFDLGFNSLGVTPVSTNPLVGFSEGLFSYFGAPVKQAVVNFDQTSASRFTLDNLIFQSPNVQPAKPIPVSIPEPASGLGFIVIAAFGGASILKGKLQAKI